MPRPGFESPIPIFLPGVGAVLLVCVLAFSACALRPHSNWTVQPEGRLNHPAIRESSGLVASRQFKDVFWTHNDSGNPASIYAVDQKGRLIREFAVPGAANLDWEDIAWDTSGNLYLFDNASLRDPEQRSFLYQFPEPNPFFNQEVEDVRRVVLRYPDGVYDAEAIFVWDETLFLITKPWDGTLPRIYRTSVTEPESTLEHMGYVPVYTMITGADISDDGSRIAICSYVAILVFEGPGTIEQRLRKQPLIGPLNARQVEGITWQGEELFISNEQREIFQISRSKWRKEKAPFLKTPREEVPWVQRVPPVSFPLREWEEGTWLRLTPGGSDGLRLGRVVWSDAGLHFGLELPADFELPPLSADLPPARDFGDWFRPGSVYLLINPGGARPLSYGENDRCLVFGQGPEGHVIAQARLLRPATYIASAEMQPDWIQVRQQGRRLLVSLTPGTPGMEQLLAKREAGFNLIVITNDGQIHSWAPMTLRYTWDAPSIWGLLKLSR